MTGEIQDRMHAGQDRCRTERMQVAEVCISWDMQDRKECRTGEMQDWIDAGQERCRTGEVQDRRDAGQEGFKSRGMQDWSHAGHNFPV